ncbi:MAG: hypothetical protein KGY50_04035 [Candidatus Thermoplasmatota archaeon]|nr:hypothetical protein [Candidatus Thermoplasmatota archaeon]
MVHIIETVFGEFVTKHNIEFKEMQSLEDAQNAIKEIGSDPNSIPIMSPKMVHRVIRINNVVLQDAIIIKQDMLSVGGEVAVPKKTFELHQEKASILVSGTVHQYRLLISKLKRHYSRIQKIAIELETIMDKIT